MPVHGNASALTPTQGASVGRAVSEWRGLVSGGASDAARVLPPRRLWNNCHKIFHRKSGGKLPCADGRLLVSFIVETFNAGPASISIQFDL